MPSPPSSAASCCCPVIELRSTHNETRAPTFNGRTIPNTPVSCGTVATTVPPATGLTSAPGGAAYIRLFGLVAGETGVPFTSNVNDELDVTVMMCVPLYSGWSVPRIVTAWPVGNPGDPDTFPEGLVPLRVIT